MGKQETVTAEQKLAAAKACLEEASKRLTEAQDALDSAFREHRRAWGEVLKEETAPIAHDDFCVTRHPCDCTAGMPKPPTEFAANPSDFMKSGINPRAPREDETIYEWMQRQPK